MFHKILKPFRFILKLIFLFPLVIVLHCLFGLLILSISPFVIWRKILFYIGPIVKPGLGKMINLPGAGFLSNSNTLSGSILAEIEIHGQVDLKQFKSEYEAKILDLVKPNGQYVFEELRQYPVLWGGYLFWKNCKKFEIDQHISFLKEKISDDLDEKEVLHKINLIRKEILNEKFPKCRPQWNITFVYNPKTNITLLFLKFHHSICDGLSKLKLLVRIFPEKMQECEASIKKIRKTPNIFIQIAQFIIKIFYTPFILTEYLFLIQFNQTDWQKNIKPQDFHLNSWDIPVGQSNLIKFSNIKEIAQIHGVSVYSVILSGIYGGIRQFMLKRGHKIPKYLIYGAPIPRQNHPDQKLRNYAFAAVFPFPMGGENSLERLKKIDNQMEIIRKYTFLIHFVYFMSLVLLTVPHNIIRYFTKFVFQRNTPQPLPVTYSALPKPKGQYIYQDRQIVNFLGFLNPVYVLGLPLFLSSTSTSKGLRFMGTGIKSAFKSDQEMQDMLIDIENEFDNLKNCQNTSFDIV